MENILEELQDDFHIVKNEKLTLLSISVTIIQES
jgi:hypothetical protein